MSKEIVRLKKGYVDTDDGQVHYREAGESNDGPPILFSHQNVCSGQLFNEVLEALEDQYHVLALDTPGFGMSYTPDEVPSVSYYVDAVTQAIDNLGIDSFHFVGQHTGASIGVELANNEPERLETVTLVGPLYLSDEVKEELRADFDGTNAAPPIDEDGEYLAHTWKYLEMVGATESPEMRHRQVIDALLAREGSKQSYSVVWDHDFNTLFENVESPRMVMGCPGDALWQGYKRIEEEFPEVRAVEVSGDNFEPIRDTENFANAIREFVKDTG